jgi:precorrin-3B methylase
MNNPIEEAQAQLDAANAIYLDELRRDSVRPEGSGAQERRREEHQQRLKNEIDRCERALELAKKDRPGA